MKRESTDHIVVHCSATKPSQDVGASEIRQWYLDRGLSNIGYHLVIRRDGPVENGRPLSNVGAHVRGYNRVSIGICLSGGMGVMIGPIVTSTIISLRNSP